MSSRRVIVIEDNAEVAELQRFILEMAGHQVTLMTEGFGRALEPETYDAIDTVVLDLMLPEVDGETITRFLYDTRPDVKRVICTAKPISSLLDIASYADVVLLKPFTERALVEAVA